MGERARYGIGDPIDVSRPFLKDGKPEPVWLPATVARDDGWQIVVVFSDGERLAVQPQDVRRAPMTTCPLHQARVGQPLADRLERDARGQDAIGTPRARALAKTMRDAATALRTRPSVEEIARAIFDAENVPENQVSWDEWIVYTKTKSFLGKEIKLCRRRARAVAALLNAPPCNSTDVVDRTFALGARVRKTKGSSWQGHVVGFYSTTLTPDGVCVESEREPGSVQIYPAHALEHVAPETPVERDGGAS